MCRKTKAARATSICSSGFQSTRLLATVARTPQMKHSEWSKVQSGPQGITNSMRPKMEDRMKKILVAGLAVSALFGGSAGAADLGRPPPPVYAPPPPVVAFFTWTGCYVGGNGGGVWANRTWTDQTLILPGADL